MNQAIGELSVPEAALRDEQAVELLRVWAAVGGIHISLQPEMWHDPGAWGIALAEVIRKLTEVYRQNSGTEPSDTMRRVCAILTAECLTYDTRNRIAREEADPKANEDFP
jgi:Domain of unknown function (DUF5076)